MKTFYVSLGANLGNPLRQLQEAVRLLRQEPAFHVTAVSPWYTTPPWGKTDQPPFINGALSLETELGGEEVLSRCQAIETKLGRVRHEKWGARTLDIDLVYSPDETCQSDSLTLPHPYVTQRAFVLVPLQDIAPELRLCGQPLSYWLSRLPQDVAAIRQCHA